MFGTSQGPIDARLAGFSSLYELCSGHPVGMGYYCLPDGSVATHPPVWPLYGNFLYVRNYCNNCCWCEDLAPDIEDTVTGTGAVTEMEREGCESETDNFGAVVANECAGSAANPLRTDNVGCSLVMYGHPPESDCEQAIAMITARTEEPLQVREFLGISGVPAQYSNYQKVQTPQSFTVGRCTVSVLVLEGRHDSTDLESWDYIAKRASAIRMKCVHGFLCGGWTKAGLMSESIGVFIHGPRSKFEAFVAAHYVCIPNPEGVMECESLSPQRPKRPSDNAANDGRPSKMCGGACNQRSDCSIDDDCICASDKGIPLSATWGTFRCMHSFSSACRGRCLVEGNGTLEIPAVAAAAPDNTSSTFNFSATACPCNCTYVSAACCLSPTGIVFEDPILKINTTVQAPNGSVCCDHQTGKWANATVLRDEPQPDPSCETVGQSRNQSTTGGGGIINF